jgi:YggT family protein
MTSLIFNAFYVFFVVLEIILFLYIFTSWLRISGKIKNILLILIEPVLTPVRYLLKHSIFNSPAADLSPIISFIIIVFLQNFFSKLR